MESTEVRLPVPKRAHKDSPYRVAGRDEGAPVGLGVVLNSIVIGGASVSMGISFTPLLLLILLIPVMHLAFFTYHMKGSRVFFWEDKYGDDKGLYFRGVQEYNKLYDADHRADALPLLQKIYDHEVALADIGKPHKTGRYDDADCKPCAKRIKLIRELDGFQPIPGTETFDIEHMEAQLEVKREMKAIMAS